MKVLLDSNILLDVFTEDKSFYLSSSRLISSLAEDFELFINPIIYAEISIGFKRIEELESALPNGLIKKINLPWEAAFLAGKCFLQYRKSGGNKLTPLPDFYIGAHAAVCGMDLATRDVSRYKTYFPKVKIHTGL